MKVYSTQPLERVAYFGYAGGDPADVYLRDNIEEADIELAEGGTQKQYVADEVHFKTDLAKEDVEANFDDLWVKAEYEQRPLNQRISDLEALMDDTISLILGGE